MSEIDQTEREPMKRAIEPSIREQGQTTSPRPGGTALWVFLLRKFAFLVPLIVAFAALAAATISVANAAPPANAEPPAPSAESELPPRCAANYAALLDLAELAREYGKSSVSFVHAIDSVAGQLDDCLYDAQGPNPEQGPAWQSLVKGAGQPSAVKHNAIGI
ncbi:hypothetical protein FAZ95_31210 [Trinickia violacea]|uniref:Uncharacterized protein n=1 Tax=Trinickia violacea TaxID=2571746 RepID=A0A4P8IWC7_9BURK|nr:hypothetical protein [Trinickia violacea]QCP53512.1 hypothetical protein FAZ95_31210 [Trinickia violacea]